MLPIRRGAIRVDPSNPAWRQAGAGAGTAMGGLGAVCRRSRHIHRVDQPRPIHDDASGGHDLPGNRLVGTQARRPVGRGRGDVAFGTGPHVSRPRLAGQERRATHACHADGNDCDVARGPASDAVESSGAVRRLWGRDQHQILGGADTGIRGDLPHASGILPMPWEVLGRNIRSRIAKAGVVFAIAGIVVVTTIAITWAGYGFQFAPSRDPGLTLQTDLPRPVGIDHLLVFAESHRLLPSSFCVGLIRQHTAIQNTPNFLLESQNGTGWWYYYPFAFAVKTPLATLFLLCLAVSFAIRLRKSRTIFRDRWTARCVLVPAGGFLICAMCSSYNHGLRSLLPIYPMIYIAAGAVFALMVEHRPRPAKIAGALLLAGLMIETLSAYPNYIAFFNAAAGGSRGGLSLLGDSNLDWGQDLSLLARWRRENPDVRLVSELFWRG